MISSGKLVFRHLKVVLKRGQPTLKKTYVMGSFSSLFCYVNIGLVSFVRNKEAVAVAYNVPYNVDLAYNIGLGLVNVVIRC